MAEQTKKKRQHYVPRVVLREFSPDGGSISLVVLGTGQRIDGASLKAQCYEDYFYGEDPAVENAFAKVEGEYHSALGDFSAERLEGLSEADLFLIRFLVHLQKARTVGAAEELNQLHDTVAKQVLSKDARRLAEIGLNLDDIRIGVERPQNERLVQCAMTAPLVFDLEVRFLIAGHKLGFVTSDHPVVACNQWAENHPRFQYYQGNAGLAARGLQYFLPVSPRVCIAMYDAEVYRYGSPKRKVCQIGLRDVRLLNGLQAMNAHECLYFHPEFTTGDEVERLAGERRRHDGWRKLKSFESEIAQRPDGTSSQLIGFSVPDLRIGNKLGFISVTESDAYEGYAKVVLPTRNAALLRYSELWAKELAGKAGREDALSEMEQFSSKEPTA